MYKMSCAPRPPAAVGCRAPVHPRTGCQEALADFPHVPAKGGNVWPAPSSSRPPQPGTRTIQLANIHLENNKFLIDKPDRENGRVRAMEAVIEMNRKREHKF